MWTKQNIERIVKNSKSNSNVLKQLGLKLFTGNYDTLKRYIRLYNIDTSHYSRKMYNNYIPFKKISLKEILVKDSKYTSTVHLKDRLYKEGLKERKCEKCGQNEIWNGEYMSLILDHINGIKYDNRLENLRIVCPNCNATLETHCGKNIKKINKLHIKIKNINKIKIKNNKYCNICKKELSIYNKNGICKKCSNINKSIKERKVERPPYEQLINEIKELGYSGTGRKYSVSDNSIRKWKKYYEK